nr:plasmid mobilization relaxosome protein MobC [Ruminococcus sp. AF46-10NS]
MNDLRKLVSEYGKIGSNLNQIAKHFNSGGSQSRAILQMQIPEPVRSKTKDLNPH